MLQNVPPRQEISYPDVAIIKKGTPKQVVEKDNRKVQIQGKDLKDKFRIHFLPGTEDVQAAFHRSHAAEFVEYGDKFAIPTGYEVKSIIAVIPSPSVWDSWSYANTTYDAAGRRMGMANDDHYIFKRDGATGEYIIKDGEPYEKFTPGDVIEYERNGKRYTLKMKTDGRLRLVLKDLVNQGLLVQCILKTTSFYDCQNIKKQLAGIQNIANMVNNGNAGGVPIKIYRAQQDCVWNKPDGSAARVKQWFINLVADPDWVTAAFNRLGQNAIVGPTLTNAMLPEPTLQGNVSPESEEFDDSDGEAPEIIDAEAVGEPVSNEPQPELFKADPNQKFYYLDAKIVKMVAEKARINNTQAAQMLSGGREEGRFSEQITIAEALEFASHINM